MITNIETVKIQGNGYLLNGGIFVPKAEGNKEYEAIKQWIAEGNVPAPEFSAEELAQKEQEALIEQNKKLKEEALNNLVVTTTSGKTFDGNETARNNMLSAITSATFLNQTSAEWKLADNTVVEVTLDEIKEALALSIQEVGNIVKAY